MSFMKQLTDQERTARMDDKWSLKEQMPCVSFFCYVPIGHSFFEVRKKEIIPRKVYGPIGVLMLAGSRPLRETERKPFYHNLILSRSISPCLFLS